MTTSANWTSNWHEAVGRPVVLITSGNDVVRGVVASVDRHAPAMAVTEASTGVQHTAHPRHVRPDTSSVTLPAVTRMAALQAGLEKLGWSIRSLEIDMRRETARIELRQGSRLVVLDARNGRATVTREELYTYTEAVGRRGNQFHATCLSSRLIGRTKHDSPGEALRALASYVADNAAVPTLPSTVSTLFGLLLDGQRHAMKP